MNAAVVVILAEIAGVCLLVALARGDELIRRAFRWARDDAEAEQFSAETHATAPSEKCWLTYSTQGTPEAMRSLAAEIAEQADRIEARHAYRPVQL